LQTVFQFLDHGDRLWFDVNVKKGISLAGGVTGLQPGEDLVERAARCLADSVGMDPAVRLRIEKCLPAGGGLGGGSSDAATTLVALNRLWGLEHGVDRLAELALRLGADVPVFVHGMAAWAEGIGEQLTPMVTLDQPWYLVVNPQVSVSTAKVFSDPGLTRNGPSLKIPAFLSGAGVNQLEPVVVRRYPEVGKALEWLSKHQPARMTGSGGCVFARCAGKQQAEAILAELPAPWTGFVAQGRNQSPLQEKLAAFAK
jgi:4-diphosphocytidyl-2-C-methyl-D-erythritol kinase